MDKNGKITATSDKTTGTAYIYVTAHNGLQKKIKVSVVNYALLESVKNLKKVNENSIKELLTISKNDTSKKLQNIFNTAIIREKVRLN
ncbi:MAG: hypothetical protein ACLRR3_04510 [Eubacterium sp.]